MNLLETRRSIRNYNSKIVKDNLINKIITSGMNAPTACNRQGYKFIIINDQVIMGEIIKMGSASFLKNVSQSILVLYERRTNNREYNDNIQSGAAVIQNMLLEATSLNIGSCWVCNLPRKRVLKKMLLIPNEYDIIGLVTLGHYDQSAKKVEKKYELEDVISYNLFESKINRINKFTFVFHNIYKFIPKTKLIKKIANKYEKKFEN